jgi:Putative beta-barrel porin-2, OmpL-like. bbp2/Carboxypeptidase regulatory-like domain
LKQRLLLLPVFLVAASAINAQSPFGTIVGLIRDTAGMPVAGATVTAIKQDNGAIRSTISGSDGLYSFSDLAPGPWSIKAKAQNRPDFSLSSLDVVAGDATRADIGMAGPAAAPALVSSNAAPPSPVTKPASAVAPNAAPRPTTPVAALPKSSDGFWSHWLKGDKMSWKELTSQYPRDGVQTASLIPPPVSSFDRAAMQTANAAFPAPAALPGPNAAQTPQEATVPPVDLQTPFADFDWTWLNGNTRQKEFPLDTKYFSPEFRADTFFGLDFNQPKDHSMGGSSEVFRNGEVQLEDLSIGGDFHAGNMRGRVLMLFGMFSATTVRNDASPAVGQWDVRSAYKYVSEAYGGYHFNVQHGLNVDAGIFVSYVGLFSYHNFDNWAYQPSYVSSNTPWFFNGVRIQWFPTNHLKIEPWIINGWQSYNKFNGHLGLGGQLKWTPNSWMTVIANQYGYGTDTLGLAHRQRYHTDDSIEIKYYDKPKTGNGINRMAFTFTGDMGCESGDGVTCTGGHGPYNPLTGNGGPKQSFLGYMAYNRWWWHRDLFAFTLGGGQINNPGRYLTLVLPINGADAISGTPYFPSYPGAPFKAYDGTATFDWMPSQFMTFRTEFGYRHANVPYWTGRQGITPPGGNNGAPADFVCSNGASSGQTDMGLAMAACGGGPSSLWYPDLRRGQALLSFSIMVKL